MKERDAAYKLTKVLDVIPNTWMRRSDNFWGIYQAAGLVAIGRPTSDKHLGATFVGSE